ncbi:Collagen alpha-1(XIV) chain [Brachionus plicatilis]|uniref:Collagen alpha-1(XIV) chain n=1 Tax=Brachionus plicatilis TaxID=10195 RepID=A0A3M7S3H0_BRAPC|nr:Collagen alpha-1(XIV) chain [Brachionus plicatilis]
MLDQFFDNCKPEIPDVPPPPYTEINNQKMQKYTPDLLRDISNRYEIHHVFSNKLQLLESFKIVFIFDDSGSMNATLSDSPLNTGLLKATRWDELQFFSKISIEIANMFNQNGTDIYFLNRPMARNISSADQLLSYFKNRPAGFTPLSGVLLKVLADNNQAELRERKLLIVIVTDGEPTDNKGRIDIRNFEKILKNLNSNIHTRIVSCTDEKENVCYLNSMDRSIQRLDVIDDFRNERLKILKIQGENFNFSFGDYVVKSMMGSIVKKIDYLNESFTKSNVNPQTRKKCSLIRNFIKICDNISYLWFNSLSHNENFITIKDKINFSRDIATRVRG